MTPRHDPYAEFASHYDRQRCDWFAATYGPALFALLEERGFRGARVLDAGCGTGTLTLALAGRGHDTAGMDLSEAMLQVARAKDREHRVAWSRGDVTGFDLGSGKPFDVVTCVGDTLNHLERLEEWEAAFTAFARHLRPGGALFFDAVTVRGLERLDRYAVTDLEDTAMLVGFIYEPAGRRSTMKLTSFARLAGSGLFERASEVVTEWGQPAAGVLAALERAGFGSWERVWARSGDPEADERLTVLARRD